MSNKEQHSVTKSRHIAQNSILLFVRMFMIMVINLYAVRIILKGLGESDYGTFNAVAGVVLSSTVLTTSLAIAIQRFFSHAMGEKDYDRLNEIFSASMNIIFIVSILVIVILETVGLWFLNSQLSIPADRIIAANWVYQFSLFSFLLSLLQLPYTAAIFSHEDMGYFALISFLESLFKLIVAIFITMVPIDYLVYYGAGLATVSVLVFAMYFGVARVKYSECRYGKVTDKTIYPLLASFSGWTMYGALAGVATTQGNTILLNVFFGPLTTTAFAISLQISHAFQALSNSIILAFRPAMIKSYAEKDHRNLDLLFDASNKILLYLMVCVSVPIVFEIRTIFIWWLGVVSEETILFARLFIVYIILLTLHNPITTIVQATGNVKKYTLVVESIMLLCLLLAFVAFKSGCPSYYAIVSLIVVTILAHVLRLVLLHRQYPSYPIGQYLWSFIMPGTAVIALAIGMTSMIHFHTDNVLTRFMTVFTLSPTITLCLAYFLGISRQEKLRIRQFVQQLLKHYGL